MKVLISDLGGVLLHFSHARMCEQLANVCGFSTEQVRKMLFEENIGDHLERGILTTNELHALLCTLTRRPIELNKMLHAICDIFTPNEEMIPFLEDLKAKGVRLVLLSNTCEAHFTFAQKHFPFLKLFDSFILSYEIGARKPEEKIYRAALKEAQSPPEECFYIDDIPEYVAAAEALGIPSHTFRNLKELNYVQKI